MQGLMLSGSLTLILRYRIRGYLGGFPPEQVASVYPLALPAYAL